MIEARAFSACHKKWLLCLGIAIVALALTYWPQGLPHFRYDRQALVQGELWRLASAHLVHVGGMHVLLNIAGLLLICELLWNQMPLRHGFGLLLVSAMGIDALLWLSHPELGWYAGLSGVLHGLWAGCALALCWHACNKAAALAHLNQSRAVPAWVGAAGLILLVIKLVTEARRGGATEMAQAIGAPVIEVAHLYGALLGAGYVLAWKSWARWRRHA